MEMRWANEKGRVREICGNRLICSHNGVQYALNVRKGRIHAGKCIRLIPENDVLSIAPERMK